jgi:hypothetical protein
MSDRFGVPANMFGPVPDDFYGLVGCIALVSTLLEDKVMTKLYSLDTPLDHSGGVPSRCRDDVGTHRISVRRCA